MHRYLKYQKMALSSSMPTEINFKDYDEIVCNDGVSAINFYLYKNRIFHIVSEHAKNNFQIKIPSHIIAVYLSCLLDFLRIIPAYSGMSKYVNTVEVTEDTNLVKYITRKRIIKCDIEALKNTLPSYERERIFEIYAKAYGFQAIIGQSIDLVLTAPFFVDGLFVSEKDQINCYKSMISEYAGDGQNIVIKPHPRDTIDYKKWFENVIVLDSSISAEILGVSTSMRIRRIITLSSSAVLAFQNVDSYIILGPDYMTRFNARLQNSQYEALKNTSDYVREHVNKIEEMTIV